MVHEIVAGSDPIWTAWLVLPVPCRASTSATPFVDLAGTFFLFFCSLSEAWGGTLLQLSPSFLKTSLVTSSRWWDLHWLWMFSWQRVWSLLPFQVFLGYPLGDLRVDLTQLFFMESPNRIAWHLMPWTIRFMFFVFVCMDGILAPSILPHRTSPTDAALTIYRTVIKFCVVCCFCVVIRCLSCYCFYFSVVDVVVPFFFVVVVAASLVVGLCAMTYVIFAPLYVGLLWALLYNHHGFLPSRLSGGFLSCWFSIKFLFFIQKKNLEDPSWKTWNLTTWLPISRPTECFSSSGHGG